ncbi:MAG: V-type ATP synthase subunit A [Candidatus Coatesbacteria bacterium]|nr:V-type ATP synthase subunit A [Candidatus Coatesbacteria bacterium]
MRSGKVIAINGNMVTSTFEEKVIQNEVAYIVLNENLRLKAEVIRIHNEFCDMQVFEETNQIKVGDSVEFSNELLSVVLGPGMLGTVFDGLQNPLYRLAEETGFFLQRGKYIFPLDPDRVWKFAPSVNTGETLKGGMEIGFVNEGIFDHKIFVPFNIKEKCKILHIAAKGDYKIKDRLAILSNDSGKEYEINMTQTWPVKIPIKTYKEKLLPDTPLMTGYRIIDTFFPIARGGTFCIPGPFGAGKTVVQQTISRNALVDIVVVAACGERAGEVVEVLREFPEIKDPRTGRSLMERTCIICNTSSMPVAAREASVYTAVTIAEYYRQMGLNVLLLADSTSRWAQALREMSGRLEEIPGEEAFPAYLQSVISAFYERSGLVELYDKKTGSVTIGGTVSPAGGNFEEPVTMSTLSVVGAFLGLSRQRSDARKYPAIDPLISWSKYQEQMEENLLKTRSRTWVKDILKLHDLLFRGEEIYQQMMVVGEEGTAMNDFIIYLKSYFLDSVFLQQDAYDDVDSFCSEERQVKMLYVVKKFVDKDFTFKNKDEARAFFMKLIGTFSRWNTEPRESEEARELEVEINKMLEGVL